MSNKERDVDSLFDLIKSKKARYVDLRFSSMFGRPHHLTMPVQAFSREVCQKGAMFDGSSIPGWRKINESDMRIRPDVTTAFVDPFIPDTTIVLYCEVLHTDAETKHYNRDPRSIAYKAESYLMNSGIADEANFGPEPEFFLFDDVRWGCEGRRNFSVIDSVEGAWCSKRDQEDGNLGHYNPNQGGYFALQPHDATFDVRTSITGALMDVGINVALHHHEVGGAGQAEICFEYDTLKRKGDQLETFKYCVKNIAYAHGMTATFMPKPIVGENGSGMHVHQSLFKDGVNLFYGDQYGSLSETAIHYVGGIFKHAKALNALTNPSVNSYKRLVSGYEAPVLLAYSMVNRSCSCRIPSFSTPEQARVEIRFPDASGSGYLTLVALMMAGLDGIENRIHPGEPVAEDLYELDKDSVKSFNSVSASLEEALESLDADRDFLLKGDVMDNDMIDAYLSEREKQAQELRLQVHPKELELYYSC